MKNGGDTALELPVFNVVMLYEDFESGKAAKRAYDQLTANLLESCAARNQMWKFEVLTIPKLRNMALQDGVEADVVIVSLRGDNALPDHIKSWVEGWLRAPRKTMAMIALFDPRVRANWHAAEALTFLKYAAKEARVEFFSDSRVQTGFREDESYRPANSRIPPHIPAKNISDNAAPRWGLNE